MALDCKECGGSFTPRQARQSFCQSACRKKFHNRRMVRGQRLYDLMMMQRYDRKGDGPEAFKLACRHTQNFKAEDVAAGRGRSWLNLKELRDEGLLLEAATTRGRT